MINRVILLGRVGTKKFKPTKNGSIICMMNVATSKRYIDSKGNAIVKTTWHFVNFFNHLAEIANKISNIGDLIYVEGEIDIKKEVDSEGKEKIHYSIVANSVKVIQTAKKDQVSSQNYDSIGYSYESDKGSDTLDDESITF
jgi:single stranded DNA-binding protein